MDYLTGPLRGLRRLTFREHVIPWFTILLPVSVYLWLIATRENFPSKIVFWIGFPIVVAVYVLVSMFLK
jgi:hypothetical protein